MRAVLSRAEQELSCLRLLECWFQLVTDQLQKAPAGAAAEWALPSRGSQPAARLGAAKRCSGCLSLLCPYPYSEASRTTDKPQHILPAQLWTCSLRFPPWAPGCPRGEELGTLSLGGAVATPPLPKHAASRGDSTIFAWALESYGKAGVKQEPPKAG